MPLKRHRPVQSHPTKRIVRLRHIVGGRRRRWCRGTADGRIHTRTERGSSHTLGRRRNNHIVFRILEAGVLADKAQAHIAHGTVTVLGYDNLRHTAQVCAVGGSINRHPAQWLRTREGRSTADACPLLPHGSLHHGSTETGR